MMSDVKIGPPTGPTQGPAEGAERTAPTGKAFELVDSSAADATESTSTTPSTTAVSTVTEPAALVHELRAGNIDMEQAVEILIEQALQAQPLASMTPSQAMRQEIRQALVELVRDDPTLASLAASMKR